MVIDDTAYRTLLTERAGPILIADATGTFRYVNDAACALLGWEREELVGKPITAIIPPAMRARHQEGFRRYLATGVPRVLGRPIRVPVRCRNGAEPRLELTLSTLDSTNGPLFIATLRELTAARAEERAVGELRALEALQQTALALEGGTAEEVATRGAEALQTYLGATVARIWLTDETGEWLRQPPRVRQRLGTPDPLPVEVAWSDPDSLVARVARSNAPYLRNHLEEDAHWNGDWLRLHQLQSAALTPLRSGTNLVGVLGYFSDQSISAEMAGLLNLFAALLAGELAAATGARLEAALRREQRRRTVLAGLIHQAARGDTAGKLAAEIVEAARELTKSDEGFLALRLPGEDGLRVVACAGYPSPITGYMIECGCGASSVALAEARTLIVPNYRSFPKALPPLRQRGVQAVVVAPIFQGAAGIGVLKVESKRPGRAYEPTERALLEECAGIAALGLRTLSEWE